MEILRYNAFSSGPGGGNPAGVVLDAQDIDEQTMQQTARAVGYSETAFVQPEPGGALNIRYFSPECEVPFCGHATIATAVAYAERNGVGPMLLNTLAGPVSVETKRRADRTTSATLVSVPPRTTAISDSDLEALLDALDWSPADLDPALPPRAAYAGAWHPIIAAATRERLAELHYDMKKLLPLMDRLGWATVDLIWRESPTTFHARNPFPPGGVVEDPATGAAAAALGGYLRDRSLIATPASIEIHQGHDMGRPSLINVDIPADMASGIAVTGGATPIEPDQIGKPDGS